MDFKTRHPVLTSWPEEAFDEIETLFPYDGLFTGSFATIPAFDRSTTFLLLIEGLSQDESVWYGYGIEAPPNDPMRILFENGEVSWSDFMGHRNWLIEFVVPFPEGSFITARYISPNAMSDKAKNELADLDAKGGPYQILHDHLLNHRNWERENRPDRFESEGRYLEFLENCGGRFKREDKAA